MRAALAALALAAACAAPTTKVPQAPPAEPALYTALPAGDTAWSNRSLAALLATLVFEAEWGGRRAHLVRFEAPVRVALEGPGAQRHAGFLAGYFAYLRRHAGIDIALAPLGRMLVIGFVPGGDFRALLPGAACTLVPGDRAWADFAADPDRLGGRALIAARRVEAMTIFLPADAAPWRVRACLLEEIAQALGPINDLYGLGASIFNDDFAHLWPTRLDLLMLRVLYASEMRTGLAPTEAEARARAVLDRINPAGRRARDLPRPRLADGARWRRLIGQATAHGTAPGRRRALAADALALSEAAAPGSPWHCLSLTLLGRLLTPADPNAALVHLRRAESVCARAHGAGDVRLLRLRLSIAAALLALDRPAEALEAVAGLGPSLAAHGLDAGVAEVYALTGRASLALGRGAEAAAAARRAEAWEAYAFGTSAPAP